MSTIDALTHNQLLLILAVVAAPVLLKALASSEIHEGFLAVFLLAALFVVVTW